MVTSRTTLTLKQPLQRPKRSIETPKSMRAMRKALHARWPELFDKRRPAPLAIGIHVALIEATGYEPKRLHRFLAYWTHRPPYLKAVERGAPRSALPARNDNTETRS